MPKKRKNKVAPTAYKEDDEKKSEIKDEQKICMDDEKYEELLSQWPQGRTKIPGIFLHNPADFKQHVKIMLGLKIKFYQPHSGSIFTRINCVTIDDYKMMIKYFTDKNLPYHTFGMPSKKKFKVVMRGLPVDTDLRNLLADLKAASLPVLRLHKMHTNGSGQYHSLLIYVVLPYSDDGKKMLKVKTVYGHNVKLEPPKAKPKQCYRCQKWGHVQRYCHGHIKCLKCAEDHFYNKCQRNRDEEPPRCSNCGGDHTANFKRCPLYPDNVAMQVKQVYRNQHLGQQVEIVTYKNMDRLYRNVRHT